MAFFGDSMGRKLKHVVQRIKEGRLKEMKAELLWIWGYGKPHIFLIIIYTLFGLSGTVVSLISSLVSRDLVDIITGHKTGELIFTFVSMFVITIISTLIGQISSYVSTKISMRIENRIKSEVFDEIMSSDWEHLMKYNSGDIIVRWSGDVGVVSTGILTLFPNAVVCVFQFASALYMVCKYDASFAIFAIAGIPLSLLISKESMRRMRKNNMSTLAITSKITGFNQEAFGNVQILKAFDMLPFYSKRLKELQKEYTEVRLKYQKMAIINAIFLTILSMLVSCSAQAWGIYKVWSNQITYGTMTMFIALSGTLTGTVNNMISLFPSSIQITNAAKRLMDITGMPKEDFSKREEVAEFYQKHKAEGIGMHIRNVTYAYQGGESIFENANFDAFPRDVVALVGPSGEGKTTMMRYLLAIITSKEGESFITAGRNPIESGERIEISASARQLFSYVPQGNTMLTGTIAENMRKIKEEATDEEIVEALKMACAWKFVEKLPEGINTEIKERGGSFSEGQSQRLSIARALLKKSPILLLDEATSALDIETEREVIKNIMKDSQARTCIVATHRPSVLTACDRVYSIKNKECRVLTKEEVDHLINDF